MGFFLYLAFSVPLCLCGEIRSFLRPRPRSEPLVVPYPLRAINACLSTDLLIS